MNKNQVEYNQTVRIFEDTMKQVKEAIEAYKNASLEQRNEMGITEADYIRLNRVIQLAYKYLPKRSVNTNEAQELSKTQKIFIQLVEKFRGLGLSKKKAIAPNNNSKSHVYNPYQMSEELISTLRTLRNLDKLLSTVNAYDIKSEEEMLNAIPSGNVIKEDSGAPGILDDYRQGSWGVERICLDGMQNHLPSDSLGTGCWLHFLVDGKWVDATVAKETPEKITKVRFSDDGVGYFPFNLKHLHSTKGNDIGSVGQFGEGMKLASMASVNLGLGLELQSQNWSAFAVGVDVESVNTRNGNAVEKHKKLEYKIKEYDGEPIKGSRTIFHTPTPEFIQYALKLPDKILPLNQSFKYLHTSEYGDIVSTKKGGDVFVKGVFVKNINSLFSYNFDDAGLTPDRNEIINFDVESHIGNILENVNDIRIIKSLITKMFAFQNANPNMKIGENYYSNCPVELKFGRRFYNNFARGEGVPSLWKEAFEQVFEQKDLVNSNGEKKEAILQTDYEVPEEFKNKLDEYNIVKLPIYWAQALGIAGVKTDRETLPDFIKTDLVSSITTDYGKDVWGIGHMLVDAAQNHFPSDSGGMNFFLRFQDEQGLWHDYTEIDKFDSKSIKKLKISDNGVGYDYERLALFNSGKDHSVTSGRWGEGLKMLTAAALREGVKLEFRSRDWRAIPYAKKSIIDEGLPSQKEVEKVAFDVTRLIKEDSKLLSDNDIIRDNRGYEFSEISSTTFVDPSPELIAEFKRLKNKIVFLQREHPLINGETIDLLDYCSGNIFVRNILIPNIHGVKYGYHFKSFDIQGRDRNLITADAIKEQLRPFLESVKDERFISNFLRDAKDIAEGKGNFIEFDTKFKISSGTEQADWWIKVFKETFGPSTAIRAVSDQDMNAVHMAKHVGLDMVTLPKNVADALINLRGRDGQTIPSYKELLNDANDNTIKVQDSDLTDYEKFLISYLKESPILSKDIKQNRIEVHVFEYPHDYTGFRAAGLGSSGVILINREILNGDLYNLLHVFYHEAGHAFTNAEDADMAFRDFFTKLLAKVTMQNLPLDKVLLDKLGKEKYNIVMGQTTQNQLPNSWVPSYGDLSEDINSEVKKGR